MKILVILYFSLYFLFSCSPLTAYIVAPLRIILLHLVGQASCYKSCSIMHYVDPMVGLLEVVEGSLDCIMPYQTQTIDYF